MFLPHPFFCNNQHRLSITHFSYFYYTSFSPIFQQHIANIFFLWNFSGKTNTLTPAKLSIFFLIVPAPLQLTDSRRSVILRGQRRRKGKKRSAARWPRIFSSAIQFCPFSFSRAARAADCSASFLLWPVPVEYAS